MHKYSIVGMSFVALIALALLGFATNSVYAAPVAQTTATPATTTTVEPTTDPATTPQTTTTADPAATADVTTTAAPAATAGTTTTPGTATTPTTTTPGTLPQTDGGNGFGNFLPLILLAGIFAVIGVGAALANRSTTRL